MRHLLLILFLFLFLPSVIFANDSKMWKLNLEDQSRICKSIINPSANSLLLNVTYLVQNGKYFTGNSSYWGGNLKGKIRSGNKIGLNSNYYNFLG